MRGHAKKQISQLVVQSTQQYIITHNLVFRKSSSILFIFYLFFRTSSVLKKRYIEKSIENTGFNGSTHCFYKSYFSVLKCCKPFFFLLFNKVILPTAFFFLFPVMQAADPRGMGKTIKGTGSCFIRCHILSCAWIYARVRANCRLRRRKNHDI